MSFTAKGTKEPIFGAFWFKALLDTDFDTRTAEYHSAGVSARRRLPLFGV